MYSAPISIWPISARNGRIIADSFPFTSERPFLPYQCVRNGSSWWPNIMPFSNIVFHIQEQSTRFSVAFMSAIIGLFCIWKVFLHEFHSGIRIENCIQNSVLPEPDPQIVISFSPKHAEDSRPKPPMPRNYSQITHLFSRSLSIFSKQQYNICRAKQLNPLNYIHDDHVENQILLKQLVFKVFATAIWLFMYPGSFIDAVLQRSGYIFHIQPTPVLGQICMVR